MTRGQKIALGVVLVPCLGGGLLFGMVQWKLFSVGSTLDAELDRARQAGIPTEVSQLEPNVPAGQNGAPYYAKAMAILSDDRMLNKAVDQAGALDSRATAARAAVQKNAYAYVAKKPLIGLIEQAGDRPFATFDHDWSRGFEVSLNELPMLKQFDRLLCAKAERQSADGDWKGALTSIRRAAQIGRHAEGEQILIGLLVRISCDAISLRSLQRIIGQHSHDPEFLREAGSTLNAFGDLPNFKRSLEGEFVISRATVGRLRSARDFGGEETGQDRLIGALVSNQSVLRALEATRVRSFVDLLLALPDDPSQWKPAKDAAAAYDQKMLADQSPLNYLNRLLSPLFTQAAYAVGKEDAMRRLTRAQLEIYAIRNRTGHLPATLSASPNTTDPFSGKSFVYHPEGESFRLYSVGINGRDEQGRVAEDNDDIALGGP